MLGLVPLKFSGWNLTFEEEGDDSLKMVCIEMKCQGAESYNNVMDCDGSVERGSGDLFCRCDLPIRYGMIILCTSVNKSDGSLKYPPGFTLNVEDGGSTIPANDVEENSRSNEPMDRTDVENQVNARSGIHIRPRFQLVGWQTMGFDMPGLAQSAKKDWVKKLCVLHKWKLPLEGVLNLVAINRDVDEKSFCEGEVSNAEIKKAVWDCGIDKAPGPDGFTFGFYRRYWNLIEKDVVDAIRWFFEFGNIPKGGNSSFISLIPKIPNANMVKDFRPISLIGSVYKIIAKILANRLVMVVGDLVNEIQSAFVADRQILDGPFILNELVQWCKAKKKQTMVFKVDFEKAYDSVRWDFLNDVMKKFGFGEKWCNWIRKCLQTSRGSVLVNGSPTQEFQFYKGLKQGDPLSPFLFILVMKSLHTSSQRVVDGGFFKGIKLNSSLYMSHLFYADDVIFMRQWNQDNIDTLIRVLDVFYRASRLRINMSKSKLLGISVETSKMEQDATKIGCSMLKLLVMYLGARMWVIKFSQLTPGRRLLMVMGSRLSKWKVKSLFDRW
ncbi:RNA-directed DNA polymerase, eukaryota [Tanacetum coccineum]